MRTLYRSMAGLENRICVHPSIHPSMHSFVCTRHSHNWLRVAWVWFEIWTVHISQWFPLNIGYNLKFKHKFVTAYGSVVVVDFLVIKSGKSCFVHLLPSIESSLIPRVIFKSEKETKWTEIKKRKKCAVKFKLWIRFVDSALFSIHFSSRLIKINIQWVFVHHQ